MSEQRRVVITGLGAITSIGLNTPDFWSSLCAGKNGAAAISRFDTEGMGSKIAAPINNYDPLAYFDKKTARKNDRFMQFALIAAREAFKDSGLVITEENAERAGTAIGSGVGGLGFLEEQHTVLMEKGPRRVSPFLIPKMIANMAAGVVSIDLGLKSHNICIVTACASGTHCIGEALKIIKYGEADIMVAGGTEAAITPLGIVGFSNMRALTTRNDDPGHASRPFDRERDGFLMGEGAGILVIEELEHAKARNAQIYAELIGYGLSGDAYHFTAPAPEGEGGARAIKAALNFAGLNPEDIDHINAHGTSTLLNDKLETQAIKTVFGPHAQNIHISSNKSMIGHLLGAAGGVEAVSMAMTLKQDIVPPTINLENPDPECDLDYVPHTARECTVRAAASNSLGFGGHNATIVMKKFEG